MMEQRNDNNTPITPAATGYLNNNDGPHHLRTPASAYSVPSADLNPSLLSLASDYTLRLAQAQPTMLPVPMNPYAAEWFPSEYASSESTTEAPTSAFPASPLSSATQTLVDNFAFPTMYAPNNLDLSSLFDPNLASSSTPLDCVFSDVDLAFLTGFGYPAAGLPASPVSVPIALPKMTTSEDDIVMGKGKAREVSPVAHVAPRKIVPAPTPVAGVKRGLSEVEGPVEEDEDEERPAKSSRGLDKREQNKLAARRSRARKQEEKDTLEKVVNELKDKIRQLEVALQTKNAENRVLREYMGRK